MPKEKYNIEERKKLREEILLKRITKKNNIKLYNSNLRQSLLYKFSLLIRFFYIILLSLNLICADLLSREQEEIIDEAYEEHVASASLRTGKVSALYTNHILTNVDSYTIYGKVANSTFEKGDIIVIERNIFGKPIYYSKINEEYKYPINISRMYYIILFWTIISLLLFFTSFKASKKLIIFISLIDLLASIVFFVS